MSCKVLEFKKKKTVNIEKKEAKINNFPTIRPVQFSVDEVEEMIKQTFQNLAKKKEQ